MKQESLKEGQIYHIYNRGNNRRDLFLEPIHYEHFLALFDKYITPVAETLAWVLMPNHFHLVVRIKENMVYKYSKSDTASQSGFNADRSGDAVRLTNETTGRDLSVPIAIGRRPDNVEQKVISNFWFEDHKWETIEVELFNGVGKPKKPLPHRHFAHLFNAYARYFNKLTDGTGNLFERPFKRNLIHNEGYLKQVILYVHNNPIHHGFCSHLLEYPWSSYISCVSEKPTKLKRENVLKLFNERENFKMQHFRKVETEKIEKYLELDEVDYTRELVNQFNDDRSNDAVRFPYKTTERDLSVPIAIGKAPENVGLMKDGIRNNQFNAVRSIDAVRLEDKTTAPDNVERYREMNKTNLKKEMKNKAKTC